MRILFESVLHEVVYMFLLGSMHKSISTAHAFACVLHKVVYMFLLGVA
jgi:hypothetical protein